MSEPVRDRAIRSLPTAQVRHGRLRRSAAWKTLLAVVGGFMAVVLVSGASVAAISVWQFNSNIDYVDLESIAGEPARELPTVGEWEGGFNVLLVGIDNDEGQFDSADRDGATLNDVNILVHVAEDQQSAVAVSIPRDMVVPIPSCPDPDGEGASYAMSGQPINVAYSYGGLNCVVRTVEELTELEIPYAGTISFSGVARMASAVGGVDVCIDGPIKDRYTGLDLPTAGTHTLEGRDALAFLRSRHGVGDGSDLGRISSQQVYLSSLIRKVQNEGVLTDPVSLYGLAQVTTQSMKLSSSLTPDTMVAMALALRNIPTENIVFVQYPGSTGGTGIFLGKVQPSTTLAKALFDRIRADEPFVLDDDSTGVGSTLDNPNAPDGESEPQPEETEVAVPKIGKHEPEPEPTETAEPLPVDEPEVVSGVKGQTADQYTCSVAN